MTFQMRVWGYLGDLQHLKELVLKSCLSVTGIGLKELASLTRLTKLNLPFCRRITDESLSFLVSLTSLRDLDLMACSEITDICVKRVACLTALTKLDLSFCERITDEGLKLLGEFDILEGSHFARV